MAHRAPPVERPVAGREGDRARAQPDLTALKMIPVAESVNLPFFTQFIDDSGTVQPNDVMTRSADAMLDELARITALIRPKVPVTSEPAVLVG